MSLAIKELPGNVANARLQEGHANGRMYTLPATGPESISVYSGIMVPALLEPHIPGLARVVHAQLGAGKERGHMHQPDVDEIEAGMMGGDYTVTLRHVPGEPKPLFVATSHVRPAKNGEPSHRELGGVLAERGHGRRIAAEGVWLATSVQDATRVEALVAENNVVGQGFFSKIGEEVGSRPSDYVRDPETDLPAQMLIYDVTHLPDPNVA